MIPATLSFWAGAEVPIPTLPVESMVTLVPTSVAVVPILNLSASLSSMPIV